MNYQLISRSRKSRANTKKNEDQKVKYIHDVANHAIIIQKKNAGGGGVILKGEILHRLILRRVIYWL